MNVRINLEVISQLSSSSSHRKRLTSNLTFQAITAADKLKKHVG